MYHFVSVLLGLLVTVMIAMNGKLASVHGLYTATTIIHLLGLIVIYAVLTIKRERFSKKQPLALYLAGALGVITVVSNNISFGRISVSAILALGLLGQTLSSLVFDHYGLYNMQKHPFSIKKILGICLVILGIVPMVMDSQANAFIPIILCLLAGVLSVLCRTLNASLAQRTSKLQSTFFNFATGLAVSIIAVLILGRNETLFTNFSLSENVWIYFGGIVGVAFVFLLNATVTKISSFYLTLLMFIGQVFSGIVMDIVLSGVFSLHNLIGGLLVTTGLVLNLWIEKRKKMTA